MALEDREILYLADRDPAWQLRGADRPGQVGEHCREALSVAKSEVSEACWKVFRTCKIADPETEATAVFAGSQQAVELRLLGKPTTAGADATVVDVSKTSVLNIECGDVVTFRNGDQSFSWKFDVISHRMVNLKTIAPADFKAPDLRVYVAPNDQERN